MSIKSLLAAARDLEDYKFPHFPQNISKRDLTITFHEDGSGSVESMAGVASSEFRLAVWGPTSDSEAAAELAMRDARRVTNAEAKEAWRNAVARELSGIPGVQTLNRFFEELT